MTAKLLTISVLLLVVTYASSRMNPAIYPFIYTGCVTSIVVLLLTKLKLPNLPLKK